MPKVVSVNYSLIIKHLLFWCGYVLLQAYTYSWEDTDTLSFKFAPQILFVSIPVNILLTYVNLYILLPLLYSKYRYSLYAGALLLLLFFGGLLTRFLTHYFVLPWEAIHDPQRYILENKNFWIPIRILRISLSFIPIIALTMLIELISKAYVQEKRRRETEREGLRAELDFLKAQINPHFYFNTLNSLYALTLKGAEKASQVVLRLSSLMHYILYEAAAEKVLLEDDVKHLDNYLDIEKLRFADRLELSFQCSGDIAGKMIAPLLLMPFVENAFKHGINGEADWITIDINVRKNVLYLKVENSCTKHVKPGRVAGLGIKNVKRRLELIYPNQHQLEINAHPETFEIQLSIEL